MNIYSQILRHNILNTKLLLLKSILGALIAAAILRTQSTLMPVFSDNNHLANMYLCYFLISDLAIRILTQPAARINLRPYLILNISKRKLAVLYAAFSLLNLNNLISLTFLTGFAFCLRSGSFCSKTNLLAATSLLSIIFSIVLTIKKIYHNSILVSLLLFSLPLLLLANTRLLSTVNYIQLFSSPLLLVLLSAALLLLVHFFIIKLINTLYAQD